MIPKEALCSTPIRHLTLLFVLTNKKYPNALSKTLFLSLQVRE